MRYLYALTLFATPALAADPVVEHATAQKIGATWTVSVTLSHPDTGWDHYADGWQVLLADGTDLGTRVLVHPHVNEQPFTRLLSGIPIPDGKTEIRIRPRCLVDGWAEQSYTLTLP